MPILFQCVSSSNNLVACFHILICLSICFVLIFLSFPLPFYNLFLFIVVVTYIHLVYHLCGFNITTSIQNNSHHQLTCSLCCVMALLLPYETKYI